VCGNSSIRDQIVANAGGLGGAGFGVNGRGRDGFGGGGGGGGGGGNGEATITLLESLPVRSIDWTLSVNNPCNETPWEITNEGKSIRYVVSDSENCGGSCGAIQTGEAVATILVSGRAELSLDFSGIVEWQDSGYENLQFYLDGVLIALATSRNEDRGCTYFGPPLSYYIVPPPYILEPNVNHSLSISFTTGDALYHLGCFYQADLSFAWIS
jgi:hypothetical protein